MEFKKGNRVFIKEGDFDVAGEVGQVVETYRQGCKVELEDGRLVNVRYTNLRKVSKNSL